MKHPVEKEPWQWLDNQNRRVRFRRALADYAAAVFLAVAVVWFVGIIATVLTWLYLQ